MKDVTLNRAGPSGRTRNLLAPPLRRAGGRGSSGRPVRGTTIADQPGRPPDSQQLREDFSHRGVGRKGRDERFVVPSAFRMVTPCAPFNTRSSFGCRSFASGSWRGRRGRRLSRGLRQPFAVHLGIQPIPRRSARKGRASIWERIDTEEVDRRRLMRLAGSSSSSGARIGGFDEGMIIVNKRDRLDRPRTKAGRLELAFP
jgi:hypothetical protein